MKELDDCYNLFSKVEKDDEDYRKDAPKALWSKYYTQDLRSFTESSKKYQDELAKAEEIESRIINLEAQINKRMRNMENNQKELARLKDDKIVSEDICKKHEKSRKEKVRIINLALNILK